MEKTTIEYPAELGISLNLSPTELAAEIRMAAAAKLFELGRLSSGRAAELAGVSRVRFLLEVGRYGVAVLATAPEELENEVGRATPR